MALVRILTDGSETGNSAAVKINDAISAIEKRELKVPNKGLSTEDFTTALKDKLAQGEGSHFKGVHADLTGLRKKHPSPEDGSYAYLSHGAGPITLAVWNNGYSRWEDMGTGSGGVPLTGAQIKALLFAEADTNNFDDAAKAALANAGSGGGGPAMKFNVATVADIPNVPYTEGDIGQIRNYNSTNKEAIALYTDNSNWVFFEQDRLASLGLAMVGNNLVSDQDIELKNDQVLSQDPNVVAHDKRLITVKNAFAIEVGLKNFIEQHFMPLLDEHNPSMRMDVSPTGSAAQMSVHDVEKNRLVATMEWLKSTQTFSFALMDRDTGVVKNSFDLYLDGTAKLLNKKVMTEPDVEQMVREFRHTVVLDTTDHNKATRAEAITAFKQLPHFDFTKDDAFYIKDTTGSKMISMKYFADGATDEASAGKFYFRAMSECV